MQNSVDPDQMPHSAASDLGLHCLQCPFYGMLGINGLNKRPMDQDFLTGAKHKIAYLQMPLQYCHSDQRFQLRICLKSS